jgi:uncharacterized protein (DUF2237 family)
VGGLSTGHLQLWPRNMDMGMHVYCQSVASQLAKYIRKRPSNLTGRLDPFIFRGIRIHLMD